MKISFDSFVAVLKRSGLVTAEQLKVLTDEFRSQNGDDSEGRPFGEFLVQKKLLTLWQIDKLLQGKHKGFFLGKYRLLSLLGKGGMSSVYLAEHVLMRRRCAIKVLPAKRVNDTSYLGRFHREAQAVASLDHPNIVRAYDVDHEIDGNVEIHFLVMEFVDGGTLLELVQKEGPLNPVDAAEYIRQSALGLDNAHRSGLIHRDIKPGNLLIDKQGIVKVMDLGLARFYQPDEKGDGAGGESLTLQYDEKVLGTADYLAPEQAVDSHDIDARADIYSLGCTLYFLLCGHPPFTQGTLAQRLLAHQTKDPNPIDQERPGLPPSMAVIVKKMMAKKKEDRYPTALAVAEELTNWLQRFGGDRWIALRDRSGTMGGELPLSGSGTLSPIYVGDTTISTPAPPAVSSPTPTTPAGTVVPEVVEHKVTNDPRTKGKPAAGWRNRATGGTAAPTSSPSTPPATQVPPAPHGPTGKAPTQVNTPPVVAPPRTVHTDTSQPQAPVSAPPTPSRPTTTTTLPKPPGASNATSPSRTPAPPPTTVPKPSTKLKKGAELPVVEAIPVVEPEPPTRPTPSSLPPVAPSADTIPEAEPIVAAPSTSAPSTAADVNPLTDFFSNLSSSQDDIPIMTTPPGQSGETRSESFALVTDSSIKLTRGSKSPSSKTIGRDSIAVAEPVATAEPATSSMSGGASSITKQPVTSRGLSGLMQRMNRQTLLIVVAAILLLLAVVLTILLWPDGEETPVVNAGTNPAASAVAAGPVAGEVITVGPTGHFTTITAALEFVWKNFHPLDSEQIQVIKVAGGAVYPERIVVDATDFSVVGSRLIHIVSEGESPAILRPTGTEPIIYLNQAFGITIEGFHVDAAGKPVAVRISNVTNRCELKSLKVTGFQEKGVDANGFIGTSSGRTLVNQLRLVAGSANAVCIHFSGFSESSHFDVTDSIMQGPAVAGIQFETSIEDIHVERCRFMNLKSAVQFSATGYRITEWQFHNNTLHRTGRGIVFDEPPVSGNRVRIFKNLFTEMSGPGAETLGDVAKLGGLLGGGGANYNVTTRTDPPTAQEWDIFSGKGSRGTLTVDYVSTAPESPDFLKPKGDSLTSAAAGAPEPDPYIGAIKP
ncbi:MAG: protein kinase [Planctomycetaceae bacterium]